MRLVNFYTDARPARPGVLLGDKIIDVQKAIGRLYSAREQPQEILARFASIDSILIGIPGTFQIISDAINFCKEDIEKGNAPADLVFEADRVFLRAPLEHPGKVICIGGNFPAAGKLDAPEFPVVFLKPASTITGPGMPVYLTSLTRSAAYEVELVVVIGRKVKDVLERDAPTCIAGYMIANDIGDRLLEKRTTQWTSGKMFDTFTPIGPALITPDEIQAPGNLQMETRVNAQVVQRGNTSEMFFGVDHLVSYLSSLTTLAPGDVILTGSPKLMAGEQPPSVSLKPGDTVCVSIDGLGELSNPVLEAVP